MMFFCLLMKIPNLNKFLAKVAHKKILSCKKCSWILNRTMIWNFPLWLLMCLFGWLMEMNSSTHKAHAYGLSKPCHFMCLFRWFLEMKPSSHRAHSYEFSLVWIFNCSFWRWVPGYTEHRDMDCPQHDSSCVTVYCSRRWIIYHTKHTDMNSPQDEASCVSSCSGWMWIKCHTEHNGM